ARAPYAGQSWSRFPLDLGPRSGVPAPPGAAFITGRWPRRGPDVGPARADRGLLPAQAGEGLELGGRALDVLAGLPAADDLVRGHRVGELLLGGLDVGLLRHEGFPP